MKKYRVMIAWKYGPLENYIHALERQNLEAVVVSGMEEEIHDFDGLLLPGGYDMNPAEYGEENHGSGIWHDEEDELQMHWLSSFTEMKKPVLGICRGHQVINVFFGGTLIQNLPDAEKHARDEGSSVDKYHDAEIMDESSWLQQIYGKKVLAVNSSHHQAVDKLGKGMIADAYAPDGVEEASHHAQLPVYSVQFHPERCHPDEKRPSLIDGDRIFAFFRRQIELRNK